MSRHPILALQALLLVEAGCAAASADGMAFKGGRDTTWWMPASEREQIALINHSGGVQRMALAVALDLEAPHSAVWIVPMPGDADHISLDLLESFPRLKGTDPRREARQRVAALGVAWRAFTLLGAWELLPALSVSRDLAEGGVDIFTSVERHGMRLETLRAASTSALAQHLAQSGVQIDEAALASFAPYMGEGWTLAVAWISALDELLEHFPELAGKARLPHRSPGLLVEFPSERPFFPLRPTAGYGRQPVALRLYVSGFVEPAPLGELKARFATRHFVHASADAALAAAAGVPEGSRFAYTVVQGAAWADELTADLAFAPVEPRGMRYARGLAAPAAWVATLLAGVLLLSYISGGLAGLVVFGRWAASARLGLWNVLTAAGLLLALAQRTRRPGGVLPACGWPRRLAFLAVFIVAYSLLTGGFARLLLAPLGPAPPATRSLFELRQELSAAERAAEP